MKKIYQSALILFIMLCTVNTIMAQDNTKKANAIVEEMLAAMGGIQNYNNIHYLEWEFTSRKLYWNKWTGDVRVENPKAKQVILVNVNTLKGKAFENGVLVTNSKKSAEMLQQAKEWWINDSYWLVMPWKLQDAGVKLTYIKEAKLPDGKSASILQLTFSSVGVTPNNKYWVYVEKDSHLIKQWAYYKNFDDKEPTFLKPWDDYKKVGSVLLSYDRVNEEVGPKKVVAKSKYDSALFTKL